MSFWGKTAKIVGITSMAVGGAVAITGAALLGVGCEATYTMTISGENGTSTKETVGIGSSSYGKYWIDGKLQDSPKPTDSYDKLVSDVRKDLDRIKNDTTPESKEIRNYYQAIIRAYDERLAGAVLLPIFILIAGAGLAIFLINMKKA